MKTVAIITAAGRGRRMGRPKQFIKIAGKSMLEWSILAFQKAKSVDGIILVVSEEQMKLAAGLKYAKVIKVVPGGQRRQDSVKNGLKELPDSAEVVLIHDGARPAVTMDLIEQSVAAAKKYGAAVVGVPVRETIKQIRNKLKANVSILKTIDRDSLWAAQTPQAFRASLIKEAYGKLKVKVTDDAMAVELLGFPARMVMGSPQNLKVTAPEDLVMMEAILKERKRRR